MSIETIRRRLNSIPAGVRTKVRAAMETGAAELVALMKRLVPVESGTLRDSIGWTWGEAPAGSIMVDTLSAGESLKITIYAGSTEAFYARWIEFGTRSGIYGARTPDTRKGREGKTRKVYRTHPGTAAQPFFYPAYRLLQKRIRDRITRSIRQVCREVWGVAS